MADVAREAGVSGQTVSRVANGRSNVDEGTRSRVLDAMRKVGYHPNNAARALRLGRFGNIGVIMFTLSSFGNMRTLDSIAMAASDHNYSLTLIPVRRPSQKDVTRAFARLHRQAVDGVIIVIETALIDTAEVHWPAGLPVVVIDAGADLPHPIVDTDQSEGARLATEHLLDLGHATVWHVSGPANSYSATRRRQSWSDTLLHHGRSVPAPVNGDWTSDSGYRAGLVLAANRDVTAVFTANDQMALGVLRALHERGRAVPGQVSVVGFDDMSEAKNFWPPLTTVQQNFEGVGRRSVEMLLHGIRQGTSTPANVLVPTQLVLRESTAPPAV
ncbi:LacI family DNA-binding transcriptional regulator [Kineosporia sp. NBRC 101731]|uniref:LacI family DNA-binding transcriptional regulator n=1 Tax=Kineosporia sp. NBRC 101731 TaxID=3032199 RepID=UPI0024A56C2F|nr:LacI family DNA-binding transcriptional regulator [Kineosporia sp. NBRC 101731]GLY32755.1 LacI family transcriptional regulator [Kineosporia sp. NBRC 101731]